jgi:hypothetical protein
MYIKAMSTSSLQCLPELGLCASVDPAAAGSNDSDASGARTITIVFGIIGAFLGFFTLAIAILQYRFHRQRRAGVGLVGDDIEMRPQRAAHEQSTPNASPP